MIPLADGSGLGAVEMEGRPPGSPALRREVRPEPAEHVRPGAEVVVDDVEDDSESLAMGGIDESRETRRASVHVMRCEEIDAVVAPVPLSREGCDRHQLDRRHAELAKASEVRDHCVERALGRERPDVELVEDELVQLGWAPLGIVPLEIPGVDDA